MSQRWHDHISDERWEALCDGCGLCCMHKFEDEDTGEILLTNIACKLLDVQSCRCGHYQERLSRVEACLNIREMNDAEMHWLPSSCAYRLMFEQKPLPEWHPLMTNVEDSVCEAGISMRGFCISELEVPEEKWIEHIQE